MFIKPHILIFTNVKILSIHIDFVKVANSCVHIAMVSRDLLLLFGRDLFLLFLMSAPVVSSTGLSRAGTLLPSSSTRRASIKSSGLGGCALGFKSGVALLVSILRCSAVIFVLWVRVRYGHKALFVLRAFIDPSVTGWICVVFACSQSVHFVLLNPDFFFSHDLLELAAKIGHTTRAWVPSWGLFLAASFLYISNNRFCSHIDIQSSERRWET